MIDRDAFLVYGQLRDDSGAFAGLSLGVAAYSSRFLENELVDFTQVTRAGTHYGLYLPTGSYHLLVFADSNGDGVFGQDEVLGQRGLSLGKAGLNDMVVPGVDIQLSGQVAAAWPVDLPAAKPVRLEESLFYPAGSIRPLDDALFDADIAALGLYEPAAFLGMAPTMFYALEEESYRIPVVFVHGLGGSPRDFADIASRLDSDRFKAWFFYYPTGGDLHQMAEIFYSIFLSGQAVPTGTRPMVVVAHSMGGLVVRQALNNYRGADNETPVAQFISIASPFGGHPAAALGEQQAPLVLPSWRDLAPSSRFIEELFDTPLPSSLEHLLLYAYRNDDGLKLGDNSDGVVPLSSQLRPEAQRQARSSFGFDSTHTGILRDQEAIQHIIEAIDEVGSFFPSTHLDALRDGGFDLPLDDSYSEIERYFIRTMGRYMRLLADGSLDTLGEPSLEHFVAVARGETPPTTDPERAWLKFSRDYPQYSRGAKHN